jgi:hypothetical protein
MTDYGKIIREYDTSGNANHYKRGGIENWDILKAKLSKEELRGFLKGTILNYLMRDLPNELDTVKAAWYSDRLRELDNETL